MFTYTAARALSRLGLDQRGARPASAPAHAHAAPEGRRHVLVFRGPTGKTAFITPTASREGRLPNNHPIRVVVAAARRVTRRRLLPVLRPAPAGIHGRSGPAAGPQGPPGGTGSVRWRRRCRRSPRLPARQSIRGLPNGEFAGQSRRTDFHGFAMGWTRFGHGTDAFLYRGQKVSRGRDARRCRTALGTPKTGPHA